jgi:hypothetical protein
MPKETPKAKLSNTDVEAKKEKFREFLTVMGASGEGKKAAN